MIYILKVMKSITKKHQSRSRMKENNKEGKKNPNQFSLQIHPSQGCGLTFCDLSFPTFHSDIARKISYL